MSILNKIDKHMNNILSIIDQISKSSNKNQNSFSKITKTNLLNKSSLQLEHYQNDLLTFENFSFSHLCNRDVYFVNFLYKYYLKSLF